MDGSGGLQSGFVLAALVAAVIFVDRIGGADELVRRLFQVALAAALTFAVIAGTSAAIRPPDSLDALSSSSGSSSSSSSVSNQQHQLFKDLANRNATATSIHFGFGVAALLGGVLQLRRRATLGLAFALGGLLLVLFGGVSSNANSGSNDQLSALYSVYFSAIGGVIGKGSVAADSARFAVFAGGTVALTIFGLLKWDNEPSARRRGSETPPAA